MRQKSGSARKPAEQVVKDIRRATRRHFSAEEKIRVVLEGLRGEDSIAELCRREGIVQNLYYRWSKGVSRGGQEAARRRYGAGCNLGRGQGPAPRGIRAEGGSGRAHSREPSAQKKRDGGWGGRRMRYPTAEKLEIIRLVEQSHLPVKRTLEKLGIPRATFYRWYDLYQAGGPEALDDRSPRPGRVWNRIPDDIRERIRLLALDEPDLSPRELAVRFTDTESYFVSEASVYRLLKALDLIASPAYIVIKAADEFKDKTTAPNQLWQTDFTYLKVIGWGWYYLSTVLDDFSRYIIAGALSFVTTLLPNVALRLVQAVHISPQLEEAMLRVGTAQAEIMTHREALVRAATENLRALGATTAPRATTRVLQGDPAMALVRATRSAKVDVIAVGPGSPSLIHRAFIGSVTRRVLSNAACDVLIWHPPQTN